ncbi:MAG TPA: gas vesicle protein GvpG [Candidatus Binatia bacterium]|nr:gas vesicle protein GvpG [Candidatus Binatia bacterium]
MILLDTLLWGGLRFVLRRIAEAVDAELDDEDRLREALLAARMRLELGEITEADFSALERELLARLRARRAAGAAPGGPGVRVTGVEARTWDED